MSIYNFNPEDAKRFASERGIEWKVRGDELHFKSCPYCKNKTNDKNTFAINLRTGQFKCLRASCGAHGNMITLAKDFNFSLGTEADEYFNRRKRYRNISRYPVPVTKPAAVTYMEGRGISQAITEKYHITTKKDSDNIIVFPFYDELKQLQFVKYRKADFNKDRDNSKEWSEKNCKPILFGMDQCDAERSKTLVITEGQIDSLSVAEAYDGNINVVSVPTGCNGFTWVPYCWDFLGKFTELIVFGDHEKGHITLLDDMARRFHGTVKHVQVEDYRDCKDANELLVKHGKQAVVDAVEYAEPVRNKRIKKMSEVKRLNMADMPRISTGLDRLDKLLGGFYFGQLIILTGERGFGKSTLGSQFIAEAINQGVTVFCYSGELPEGMTQDWIDRQCAGREYIDVTTDSNGHNDYSVQDDAAAMIHEWYDKQLYIYDNSIVEDDDAEYETLLQTLEDGIKQYDCKMLVIDNLMTAIEDDLSADLYRQQTAFVRALAKMSKKHDVIIILIVHPRKNDLKKFSNDDVMGSSNITNLADVIMNYTKPKEDEDMRPERVLMVTKNRLSGEVNFDGIPLWYDIPSKRILEARGLHGWRYGWNILDDFMKLPDMEGEEEIDF